MDILDSVNMLDTVPGREHVVAYLVQALCYKPDDDLMRSLNVSIYPILTAALGPVVYSTSNRNEYQTENKVSRMRSVAAQFELLTDDKLQIKCTVKLADVLFLCQDFCYNKLNRIYCNKYHHLTTIYSP
jgi:hypothetical protein